MTDITMTKMWLDANFASLFNDANKFLKMKIKHNNFGSCSEEMLSDYYLVACKNDRLKSRLTMNDDGTITVTKPITASGLATYAFNVMFDELDKKARKNLDIARCWDVTTDTDKGILKSLKQHYASPSHDLYEAVCTVTESGEVTYELADGSQEQPDANVDRLDQIGLDAMINCLNQRHKDIRKSGTVPKDGHIAIQACLEGWTSSDLARATDCNRGNARHKLNQAQQSIDYWADTHREAHRILTIKSKGGSIGRNSNPVVVELMITKGWLTPSLGITEVGTQMSTLPTVPTLFKESLSYYLYDDGVATGEEAVEPHDGTIPHLFQQLMAAANRKK